MALMLIDQAKDTACKTAEADAIRAKTGGSAQLAYDWANNKGFADAIAAIPSGGGDAPEWLDYVVNMTSSFRLNNGIPDEFEVYVPNATVWEAAFWGISKATQRSIKIKTDRPITSLASAFNTMILGDGSCVITIDADLSSCSAYSSAFAPRASGRYTHAETIIADIDFSSVTSNLTNMFNNNSSIKNITFVPNTMGYNFSIPAAPNLTNSTLVSLANCLKSAAKTLTLHATAKAKLSTILGMVSNNGTYDVFTEDAQGSTTLLDFITSTKGWTVA